MRNSGSIPLRYSSHLRKAFGLWPTWLPDAKVSIGEFGRISAGLFQSEGVLPALPGIARAHGFSDQFFATEDVTQRSLSAGLVVDAVGRARTEIIFGRSFGVLAALRGCQEKRVRATSRVALLIRDELPWAGKDLVVVVGVIEARSALITIAGTKGARMELSSSIEAADLLGQLDGEVRIVSESRLGYRCLIQGHCTPLFRLARLNSYDTISFRGGGEEGLPRLEEVSARGGLDFAASD
jgi:hypothetical protein